jgi:polyphosphate kinase 2
VVGELKREEYEALIEPMNHELVEMARWLAETGQRVIVVFEGRDTAGKGGSIQSIASVLNPRHCRIVALPAPSQRERGQWYLQRYVQHFPTKGELVLFDRSWYNRAGVERVMGYATEEEVESFLRIVPEFERQIVADGILLFKYWLCCDQEKQEARFEKRLKNPLKRWKLSPIDIEARSRYAAYTDAREAMLMATHSEHAPWTLVNFNDQAVGRLTLLRDLLDRLPDTRLPMTEMAWPPLGGEPLKERFGVLQPLEDYPIEERLKESSLAAE